MNSITDKELGAYRHFSDIPDVIDLRQLLSVQLMLIKSIAIVFILAGIFTLVFLEHISTANALMGMIGLMFILAFDGIVYLITKRKLSSLRERYDNIKFRELDKRQ